MIHNTPSDQRRSGRETVEARRPHRRRMRPILLALEERTLLSTFTVNNPTDTPVAGQTDLREAIGEANAATSASTIDFNITTPATITLFNGELELSNASYATTIDGPGAALLNISGNNASRVFQIDGGVTASLSGMTIAGGSAFNGGGLANDGGTGTLTDCAVTGNSASYGGGVYNYGGTTTLTNCTVSGNSASYGGGGLVNNTGTITLTNCTVSGNSSHGYGGGLNNNYGGTTTLTNCTVSGNSASYGGGFYNRSGTATLTNCTVSGNSGYGGGLYNNYGGTATLTNTIVAGNLSGGDIGGGGGYAGTNNLIGGNPQLAPLGNYGGPTQTMALLPGSPAIDAGTSTGAPTTDQRGDGRVGAVDIGAFESSGFTIALTSGSGQSASAAFSAPLVATVTANNPNEPVAGGVVTFTPPASGASATIQGSPAVISGDGTASVTAASNFIGGSYTVSTTSDGLAGAASFSLTNYAALSIEVSPGNPSLAVSVAGQFTAAGTFTDGSTQDMTSAVAWSSATPSVASIGGTGVATGVAPGTSAITASWQGIASPDETLTVIARSFVVNTTEDAFGFYRGTTSLREAIAGANAASGQAITFDSTVFNTAMTITLSGTQLELSNTTGTETITGPAAGVTVSGNHSSRVFQVDGGVTVSLSGMTITGGSASNGGGLADDGGTATLTNCTVSGNIAAGNGGGLYNNSGTMALINCTVSGNIAGGNGGGLYNNSGTTALTNCTVGGNSASNGGGAFTGGVYYYYGGTYYGTTALTNCTVSGNSASDGGGGLFTSSCGTTTLANTTVSANSAYFGGGLFTVGYYSTTTLTNCTVSGNSAAGSGGGGLVLNSGTATLTNCTVSGNSAGNDGGGLYNRGGTATLTNCTVSGNSAGFGAGLDCFVSTTTLTNCTVSGNSASIGGGGLVNNSGTATLTNCTVSGNSAGNNGGGLYEFDGSFSTLNIGNTIVAGNTAGTSERDVIGTFSSLGNNLIGATDGSSGWVGSDLTGTSATPLDPGLAPLGNYGGPTETMAVLLNSAAIDAGNNALVPVGVTADQRGFARIVHSVVDIGAFETNGIIVKGNIYNDQDGNGFHGGSEPGLSGWTVNLLDTSGNVLGSVLADASGNYKFSGVGLGSFYQVAETVPSGWVQTQPLYPTIYRFTAQSGINLNALNFGDHSARALDASAVIDNGRAGYTETGSWKNSVGGLDGTNRIARTVQRGNATSTATWDFTGLSSSATYDVYVTFGSKSQYSKAAPIAVYDGGKSLGTQSINESILVTMAQGGRAQGSYDGVGWLKLGTYSITGTELKVVLSNFASGSFVNADGVLLVRHGGATRSQPSRSSTSSASDLAIGVVDPNPTSTLASISKTRKNTARTVVLSTVSESAPIQVLYNAGSQPAVKQPSADAIDAIFGLGMSRGNFSGSNYLVKALPTDRLFSEKTA
jgi:parallel beta-helix repeat protein